MYTADMARAEIEGGLNATDELDQRIEREVRQSQRYGGTTASIRVSIEDDFCRTIKEELQKRGFHGIYVPEIVLKGDVDFSW